MLLLIEGVVNVVPVPKLLPPDELANQLIVPALAVAPILTVPVPHLLFGVVPVMVGIALTEAVTAIRVDVQPALVDST